MKKNVKIAENRMEWVRPYSCTICPDKKKIIHLESGMGNFQFCLFLSWLG